MGCCCCCSSVDGERGAFEGLTLREFDAPVDLCDSDGNLSRDAIGWSRRPVHRCNLSSHCCRKKQWNFWAIEDKHFHFSISLGNFDYLSTVIVHMHDRKTGANHEETWTSFCSTCDLSEAANASSHAFSSGSLSVSVQRKEKFFSFRRDGQAVVEGFTQTDGYAINLQSEKFGGNSLVVDVQVCVPPGHEILGVVIPWNVERFHYTSKQTAMPATGKIQWGNFVYDLSDAFASMDFGRGVWPYGSFWNWASLSTRAGKDVVGANFGAKWTDGTGANENAICVNSRLTKLQEDVEFQYDPKKIMEPWHLRSTKTQAVDLTFVPQYDHVADVNLLVVKSAIHRVLGHFSGTLHTEDGEEIVLRDALGCVEEHMARW